MAVPLDAPRAGTCNAQGSALVQGPVRAAYWALVWATVAASGSPQAVLAVNGSARLFGSGANAVMGPVMVPPNSQVGVQVIGATAGSTVAVEFWGFQGEAADGSDLAELAGAVITTGSLSGINQPLTIGQPVSVADGGLASATVRLGSQMVPVASGTLAAAGTLTLSIGTGTATPYPPGATSWQVIISGLGGSTTAGVRLLTSYGDGAGNTLLQEQRDSSQHVYGSIIVSGLADTLAMSWAVTVPAGGVFPVQVVVYMTGSVLPDQFYDSAIYGPQFTGSAGQLVGFDGVLWAASGWTIAAGSNQPFALPSYRGPVLLGLQSSQAMHGAFQEIDYLGNVLRSVMNFPVSSSGASQQNTTFWLPATGNQILLFNDNSSTGNSIYGELRAIKDLVA